MEKLQESAERNRVTSPPSGGSSGIPEVEIFSARSSTMKIGAIRQCLIKKLNPAPSLEQTNNT